MNKNTNIENLDVNIICMENVEEKVIKWLWKPYIAFGKITIIQGDPGEGKTTFALQLAALFSRGQKFENETGFEIDEPITIIYQTAEDGLDDTVKPRLRKANADCTRIKSIDESERSLTMTDHRLQLAIQETGAKLVILDPLQAYLGDIDMNKANEVRDVMSKLGAVARKYECAIVLIGHLNKGSAVKAAYRGIGSIDLYANARSVLLVATVPDDSTVRAVAQIKNNLEIKGDIKAFRLDENGFTWIGEYDVSADELLAGYSSNDKHKIAEDFLRKELSNGKTVPSGDIFRKAGELGVSKRTIENVKQELGITSVKIGKTWAYKMEK